MSQQNPTITQLDAAQAFKRTYDEANDAIRTVFAASGTEFAVSLDSADGDNVAVLGKTYTAKSSVTTSPGVVSSAFDCSGMKSFQLYTNTTSTIVGAQVLTLQVSPSATDNVWINTTLTITPSATSGTVVMATVNNSIVALRARVSTAAGITSGAYDLYVIAQGV